MEPKSEPDYRVLEVRIHNPADCWAKTIELAPYVPVERRDLALKMLRRHECEEALRMQCDMGDWENVVNLVLNWAYPVPEVVADGRVPQHR